MSENLNNINPQITTTTIGVRVLREINIYPLSVMEQLKLSDVVSKAIVDFFNTKDKIRKQVVINTENIEFVNFVVTILRENIMKVIAISTDEDPEKVLSDMTNDQLADFIGIIYEDNFGKIRKKVSDLIQKFLPKEEIQM